MVQEKRASVRVLETLDKWFGVTYKEDKDKTRHAVFSFFFQISFCKEVMHFYKSFPSIVIIRINNSTWFLYHPLAG